ncbi:hypothetical protein VHEMI07128 [[Torrubiella] hemipterigena]|uniref:Aminoglycoside phosphotransferase domain-containing protein n=1 Tax=[Torrubiella] hemipterigena TaxID=1531966 RepID=A0A0A1TMB8_9HYPO|nr:hypothetical protein VHEMI07128 [[Torrubiella] hemipterigena]
MTTTSMNPPPRPPLHPRRRVIDDGIPFRESIITSRERNGNRPVERPQVLYQQMPWRITNSMMKRTLRRNEWPKNPLDRDGPRIPPPANYPRRWKIDRTALRYLWVYSDFPIPTHHNTFQDTGSCYHLVQRFRNTKRLVDLPADKKEVIKAQLREIHREYRTWSTCRPGLPRTPYMVPPSRVTAGGWKIHSVWKPRRDLPPGDYYFAHNDLTQNNVLVDETGQYIVAITDWDCCGYWPEWFEKPLWELDDPKDAEKGDPEEIERCRQWLMDNCEEVVMEHIPEPDWTAE